MKISIDDLAFLDSDNIVFREGVDEYLEKFRNNQEIEPIGIFHQQDGVYYARGGRHRAYMFYARLGLREVEVVMEDVGLDERDKYHLEHGCVRVKQLVEKKL